MQRWIILPVRDTKKTGKSLGAAFEINKNKINFESFFEISTHDDRFKFRSNNFVDNQIPFPKRTNCSGI